MILSNASAIGTPHPGGSGEALEEALERLRRTVWGQKHREEKVAILQASRTKCADLSVYAVALPPGPMIHSLPWSTVPWGPPHEGKVWCKF